MNDLRNLLFRLRCICKKWGALRGEEEGLQMRIDREGRDLPALGLYPAYLRANPPHMRWLFGYRFEVLRL